MEPVFSFSSHYLPKFAPFSPLSLKSFVCKENAKQAVCEATENEEVFSFRPLWVVPLFCDLFRNWDKLEEKFPSCLLFGKKEVIM